MAMNMSNLFERKFIVSQGHTPASCQIAPQLRSLTHLYDRTTYMIPISDLLAPMGACGLTQVPVLIIGHGSAVLLPAIKGVRLPAALEMFCNC